MKKIIISESQYSRLFEGDGDSIFLDGSDTTKRDSSEVGLQPLITNPKTKKPQRAKTVTTRDYADTQSSQHFGAVGQRHSSNTI